MPTRESVANRVIAYNSDEVAAAPSAAVTDQCIRSTRDRTQRTQRHAEYPDSAGGYLGLASWYASSNRARQAIETLFVESEREYTADPARLASEITAIGHPQVTGTLDEWITWANAGITTLPIRMSSA